jgi:octanoyl-[GcvH]:protein N-octanoyltransferase
VQLVEEAEPAGAELLGRVASREIGATARLVRPSPTVAFGRLDARAPGFEAAAVAARAHGFAAVVRTVGGHAAAYTDAAVVYEEVTPTERLAVEVRERFEAMAELVAGALGSLGVDARIGEIAGEYCPGEWSVSAGGRVKLAGIAQRLVSRAALVSAVIVVGDGARVRAVLVDVYAALGLDWDPRTAGAVDDVAPGVTVEAVREALIARRGLTIR